MSNSAPLPQPSIPGTVLLAGIFTLLLLLGHYWHRIRPMMPTFSFKKSIARNDLEAIQNLLRQKVQHSPGFPPVEELLRFTLYRGNPESLEILLTHDDLIPPEIRKAALSTYLKAFDAPRQLAMVQTLLQGTFLTSQQCSSILLSLGTGGAVSLRHPHDGCQTYRRLLHTFFASQEVEVLALLDPEDLHDPDHVPGYGDVLLEEWKKRLGAERNGG